LIILECEQGSPEWLEARRGRPTSSQLKNIITPGGNLSASYDSYMNELLAEHVDPSRVMKRFKSKHMARGNKMEPLARQRYESLTGHEVTEVGGIFLDDNRDSLSSPDGLILDLKKGLEIKCPDLKTHIGYLREWWKDPSFTPNEYKIQCLSGLAYSDLETWDFVSFHPLAPTMITTVARDEKVINRIRTGVRSFIQELNELKPKFDGFTVRRTS
jgi:hypothetical protein